MSSIADRLATGMRITVVLLPLAIGVTIGSRVAFATLQWGRAFIVWQLLWWLFISALLGVTTFYLARAVIPGITDDDTKFQLEVLGLLGGLALLMAGLSASIVIIINGHVVSAPVPFYWPIPAGACLLMVGGRASTETSQMLEINRRIETRERETGEEQQKRWKEATDLQKLEFEDQFLQALYSVTAGDTRPVTLDTVWSHLRYGFWPEMIADALTVWREGKCIDIKSCSYLIDRDLRYGRQSGYEWREMSLSLTAYGRDLCRRAEQHGVPIHEESDNAYETHRSGGTNVLGPVGLVANEIAASEVIIHQSDIMYQFNRVWQSLPNRDIELLAKELAELRAALEERATDTKPDHTIIAVYAAQLAAENGSGPTALSHLASAGKWVLGVAEEIGTNVAAAAIKAVMGS